MKKVETREQLLTILRRSRHELQEKFGVLDIAVFGSYAHGTQVRRSDIDIFVELAPSRKTFDNYMELKFFLQRKTGGKVDLALKESLREELKPAILKEALHA
ncbi:MAG: nucleotidyltransferase family protein [Syntrophobacteraceae bacterium]